VPDVLTVTHHTAADIPTLQGAIISVQQQAYADRLANPFNSAERYWQRLESYASRAGFAIIIGEVGKDLAGYVFGFTLPANTGWWNGLKTDIEPAAIAEDGARTFALNELVVHPKYQGRGYAHALHDAALTGRPEKRATLLVRPNNMPARAAYDRWGWRKIGELQPFDDSPRFDAMVIDLHPPTRTLATGQ
jgi:ribosomal protein S18 acetylase RimI-like enzyme